MKWWIFDEVPAFVQRCGWNDYWFEGNRVMLCRRQIWEGDESDVPVLLALYKRVAAHFPFQTRLCMSFKCPHVQVLYGSLITPATHLLSHLHHHWSKCLSPLSGFRQGFTLTGSKLFQSDARWKADTWKKREKLLKVQKNANIASAITRMISLKNCKISFSFLI